MAQYKDIVIINLQPNLDLTIHDGSLQFSRQLTDDHIAGILLMAKNIFGPAYLDHLQLETMITPYWGVNYYNDRVEYINRRGRRLLQTNLFEDYYLITSSNQYTEYNPDLQDWFDYINQIASLSLSVPHEITQPYTCRFKTVSTVTIYQFGGGDFIEGAISVCQWFNLADTDYLDNIHLDDAIQPIAYA